ncbi:regulatory protease, partial [Thalassiosira pseudonana CCMP1335]
VTFSSVGGNVDAILALEDALALDPKKRRLLASFGLDPPTGVLLYGPPGTGKTLLARAVAQSLSSKDSKNAGNVGGAFISLKASDIVRPEIGNSEKLIVATFETARLNSPSVIFIDEFQVSAITLLQCMDDLTRWSVADPSSDTSGTRHNNNQNNRIVVLGATNTPWMIDKAFLRPGRFDRAVHVGLPDMNEREAILRVHTMNMKIASLRNDPSPSDKICNSMAKICIGFSGADLAALCRAA